MLCFVEKRVMLNKKQNTKINYKQLVDESLPLHPRHEACSYWMHEQKKEV